MRFVDDSTSLAETEDELTGDTFDAMQDFATDVGVTEMIHSFVDNIPPLLEALNTFSKIHPFVEGVFQTEVTGITLS